MARLVAMATALNVFLALVALGAAVSPTLVGRGQAQMIKALSARQQSQRNVTPSSLYRRAYHSSVVVANRLYIDGGEYSYNDTGTLTMTFESNTLTLDLSSSWNPLTVDIGVIPKPSGVPILNDPTLWYNAPQNELLQGFAGSASSWPNSSWVFDLSLWSLKLDGKGNGSWSQVLNGTSPAFENVTRPFQGSAAFAGDAAYVLGGVSTGQTTPETAGSRQQIPLPGLVTYNMTTREFTNSSATQYYETGSAQRGQMIHVPTYGRKGLFMVMGGDSSPLERYQAGNGLRDFRNISIFDPDTKSWYYQTASGDIPKQRIEFCLAGANSTNGTFEIFMYGGWNSNLGDVAVAYDELYILSIPAFQWFRVRYTAVHPRHGHTCHIVGNRQLLSIGGVDTTQSRSYGSTANGLDFATFTTRDPYPNGLGLFDISALNFSTNYNAHGEPYQQSTPVSTYYRTKSRYPSKWDSPALQSLIQTDSPISNSNTTSINSTTTSSIDSTTTSKAPKPSSSTGAIAGGIVGGISAFVLVAGSIFYLIRRRRKSKIIADATTATDTEGLSSSTPPIHEISGGGNDFGRPYAHEKSSEDVLPYSELQDDHSHVPEMDASGDVDHPAELGMSDRSKQRQQEPQQLISELD